MEESHGETGGWILPGLQHSGESLAFAGCLPRAKEIPGDDAKGASLNLPHWFIHLELPRENMVGWG